MIPVKTYGMVMFLRWIEHTRPGVIALEGLSPEERHNLVRDFLTEHYSSFQTDLQIWNQSLEEFNTHYRNLCQPSCNESIVNPFDRERFKRRRRDPIRSYLSTPIHGVVIYSRGDEEIANYLRNNIIELDSLAGLNCDIFFSLDQLYDEESGIDIVENMVSRYDDGLRLRFEDLPGILFWNKTESYYCSMKGLSEDRIREIMRVIFQDLRHDDNPRIQTIKHSYERFVTSRIR